MGKKGNAAGKNIPKVDPQKMIAESIRTNRMDTYTPFGSQRYVTTPDGRTEYRTELSPEMQAAQARMFAQAAQGSQKWNMPEKTQGILAALIARNADRIK